MTRNGEALFTNSTRAHFAERTNFVKQPTGDFLFSQKFGAEFFEYVLAI